MAINLLLLLRKLTSPSFTHYPPCSWGNTTALKYAINRNKTDVFAYLRSIGAPE